MPVPTSVAGYPPPRTVLPGRRETPITLFQAGHAWTLTGATGATGATDGTFADDTADYCLGTQSLRLITGGSGAPHDLRSPVYAPMNLSATHLSFAIKVDDYTHYSDIQLKLSSNGFADFAYCKPVYTSTSQRWAEAGLWQTITISRAEVVTGQSWGNGGWRYSGTKSNVDWTAITGLRIRCQDDAAGRMTVRINKLAHFAQPPKAVLSLVFDDGRGTHYTVAKPCLDKYALTATSAVIIDALDSGPQYLTTAQVKALARTSGWSVVVHAHDNATGSLAHQNGYDGLTYADGEADILAVQQWLQDHGHDGPNIICLPHGSWSINIPGLPNANTQVLAMLGKHFDAARSTYPNTLETWPPADPLRLRAYTASNEDTARNWLDVLDQGIAANAWIIMQFHDLVSPTTRNTEVTPATFQAFVDGVAARVSAGRLLPRTLHEVIQNGFV